MQTMEDTRMPKVIEFYRQSEVPYGCFSNFAVSPFDIYGEHFIFSEQFIMWQKAVEFGDRETMHKILAATDPATCKALGRQVRNYDDTTWCQKRFELVLPGLMAKFEQNPEMCKVLLSTGEAIIAECSPRDTTWGIGLGVGNSRAQDPSQWRGANLLGELLMTTRAGLLSLGY